MDALKVDLSLDACPSPRDLSGRRLHRRPGARQPGGASRLLRLLPSALRGQPCVRGCGLRTSTRRRARRRSWRGSASAGRRPSFAATAGRDGTWCEDNGVDYLFGLSRNARLTERRQLRKSRRRCVSTGEARFCDFRYRTRTSWSRTRRAVGLPDPRGARFVVTSLGRKRAGAQILYEKLYCLHGENRGAAACSPTGPRPCGRTSCVSTSRRSPAAWRRRGSAWPAPGKTGRRPVRTKLLKVAILISVRRVPLSFSSVCPWKDLFARVLANLRAPPTPT